MFLECSKTSSHMLPASKVLGDTLSRNSTVPYCLLRASSVERSTGLVLMFDGLWPGFEFHYDKQVGISDSNMY